MATPIFIIEHLEPKLWPWCLIEYRNISKIVGKNNLWFANIQQRDKKKLSRYGKVFSQSATTMKLQKVCILDPAAKKNLVSNDKIKFSYYVFGGILGDNPPRNRTEVELTSKFQNASKRNIGKAQLSTDNAVYVVNKILNGTSLQKISFADSIEIKLGKFESTILPFRYPLVKGKPNLPRGLIAYLRRN